MTQRIKILARKNLRMSSGKLAAQAAHAVLALPDAKPDMSIAVLLVSDRKFAEAKEMPGVVVIRDAGLTEVEPGTETVMAFFVSDETDRPYKRSRSEKEFPDWHNAVQMVRSAGYEHPAELIENMADYIDEQHSQLLILRDECGRMPDGRK